MQTHARPNAHAHNAQMSQSNATHVRLLNASLESDGSYACEISTQNLSTIRHEREIRVYGWCLINLIKSTRVAQRLAQTNLRPLASPRLTLDCQHRTLNDNNNYYHCNPI